MSSFQFPANPDDGDIVVRGDLQAFYNAATNTWRVSKLEEVGGIPGPTGPPGPPGPPGTGMKISGSVFNQDDLPPANAHQFEFWLVDSSNKLFYSDGLNWLDFGSPIQGPPGDAGEDGEDGQDGNSGRGWYGTTIIDERPTNYQISFLSNDGLGFTTGNIMGAQGESGDMEVATEDNCGCIKIGRGLKIVPDGTVSVNRTDVDIETVPLPGDYILPFTPIYSDFGGRTFVDNSLWESQKNSDQAGEIWTEEWQSFTMPEGSDAATVFWFQPSGMFSNPSKTPPNGASLNTYMGRYIIWMDVENATYMTGNMGMNQFHHVAAYNVNSQAVDERQTTILGTKLNEIQYAEGATVRFRRRVERITGAYTRTEFRLARLHLLPFKQPDDVAGTRAATYDIRESGRPREGDAEFYHKLTPTESRAFTADQQKLRLRSAIIQAQTMITFPDSMITTEERTQLENVRASLIAAYDQPGTPEDIDNYLQPLFNQINAFLTGTFRYEI